ncbi:MAG: sigma-70 family RNA polymerase sigma factor [Solirubrobacteraceae bacterium]
MAFVRRGDRTAFEVLYERHAGELLSFCVYMLSSRQDAEDAVQATLMSAYRALRVDERPIALRPWLFAIARNECLSILRKRRPTVELNGEPALGGDPSRELELHEEVGHIIEGLRGLPESQRAALVLAELHGLSQVEIAAVLGVRAEQVKAYVYQARSNLISERRARETDCREIREELASARGAALLKGRLRRHVRSCADCRVYADGVARQRRQLGALLPLVPPLLLRYHALEDALGIGAVDPATYAGSAAVGGSAAGAAVELAGGGVKALAVKVAAGVAFVGAGAGVGASVIGVPIAPLEQAPHVATAARSARTARSSLLASSAEPAGTARLGRSGSAPAGRPQVGGGPLHTGSAGQPSVSPTRQGSPAAGDGGGSGGQSGSGPGDTGNERGSNQEHRQQSEDQQQGKAERQRESEEDRRESKERQKKREQRREAPEEHKPAEHKPVGGSSPPESEEERQIKREKREQRRKAREEHKPVGGSSPPPESEEERQIKREKREQRRGAREEREQREAESGESG